MFDEARILLEGGAEKCLAGEEHDYELRRGLELFPIILAAKRLHVIADLPGVIGEAGASRFFIGRFEGVEEGLQRRLGIDHHVLAAGQLHDEIRA